MFDRSGRPARKFNGWSGRPIVAAVAAAAAVVPIVGVGLAADEAAAAPGDAMLTVTLAQATGTAPFDPDAAPGHDLGPNDDVIRTNDTITYTVGVGFEGADQTQPTLEFTLPQGEELVSLPPFCLTGSSVTPATMPDPATPITTTSWQSLPTQKIVCRVGDQTAGSSFDYKFVSKVRPEVPHGTSLGPVSATASSNEVKAPVESPTVSHRVSAAANYDISKRATATSSTTGPLHAVWEKCSFDASRTCRLVDYPLTISTPPGGKGITPLASPITLTDDLSPDAFYGPGTTTSAAWLAAGAGALDKYGARLTYCNNGPLGVYTAIPSSAVNGTYGDDKAVRDSGTITCTQATPGAPVQITITGADTTAYTVPTMSESGAALPADTGYVISTGLRVEIPIEAVNDLAQQTGGVRALQTTNTLTDFEALDISGAPNQGDDPANNVRESAVVFEASGSFGKGFSGVHGNANNTPTGAGGFTEWEYEGPPGSGTFRDGNTVVVPGQTVLSNLDLDRIMPPGTGETFGASHLMCDTWDETKLRMPETFDSPANPLLTRVQIASAGKPAWISSWFFGVGNSGWQPDASGLQDLVIQYGYTPNPGNNANSECNLGVWADTPGAVPGASVQNGVWAGVNQVRFFFSSRAPQEGGQFNVNASIALRVVDSGAPVGSVLPNWASLRTVEGGPHSLAAVLAGPADQFNSTYAPASHTGALGDRLILGTATARIKKFVQNPTTGGFSDSTVPQYAAGATVVYRLNPSLSADVSAGVAQPVIVEDCLPAYQAFISSERASGAPITPVVVRDGAPANSELVCPAGQTYVRWDLGDNIVNEAIDPIVYTVELLSTVRNDVYTNTTVVSTPGDATPVAVRDDSVQIAVVTPTGVRIAKTVMQPQIEVNPSGVETPRTLTWTVDFANIDAPENVSDVDVIDVLPADGLGGSSFNGTLRLDSVDVTSGGAVTVLYTSSTPSALALDPNDPTNGPTGATTWCDAPVGGAVTFGGGTVADCPSSLADVTGLRFVRAGAFTPADQLTIKIAMTPIDNAAGDVYRNRTAGRAKGVTQGVGPAARSVTVIASSVGDLVWDDVDGNGVQDPGEPGIAGFPVHLTGTDLDGNQVSLDTMTDADGTYLFRDLASGDYQVRFDLSALTSNSTFTLRHAGSDTGLDSNANVTTGESVVFTLPPDSANQSIDAGIKIDRNVMIMVDKRVVATTALDDQGRAVVTYELAVSNAGTANGVYDLSDALTFGGGVSIDQVEARNTDPGTIATSSVFDGQTKKLLVSGQQLSGGETHIFQVRVSTTVSTTTTAEQRDCLALNSETGTGYLNVASVTVNGVASTDAACHEVETPTTLPPSPTPTPSLPTTPSPSTPTSTESPSTPTSTAHPSDTPTPTDETTTSHAQSPTNEVSAIATESATAGDGDGDNAVALPNTGGVPLWLLALAAVAVLAGVLIVSRRPPIGSDRTQ